MTVLETPALRATSSTAKSGPTARTASTAAATSSCRRARRCSIQRDRRPSGAPSPRAPALLPRGDAARGSGGAGARVVDTPGACATPWPVCMCSTVTATFPHGIARRSSWTPPSVRPLEELDMTAILPAPARTDTATTAKKPVDRQELSSRLLGSAAKKAYDPVVDIDWEAPTPEGLYGLS